MKTIYISNTIKELKKFDIIRQNNSIEIIIESFDIIKPFTDNFRFLKKFKNVYVDIGSFGNQWGGNNIIKISGFFVTSIKNGYGECDFFSYVASCDYYTIVDKSDSEFLRYSRKIKLKNVLGK